MSKRVRLSVGGRVQGVGFRPFVYRLAEELNLAGHVGNDGRGAFIEVEGPASVVQTFMARLRLEAPPLALVDVLSRAALAPTGEVGFRILESVAGATQDAEIAPDTATCAACLAELVSPTDRRFGYPFINCTHCGPRYSIVLGLPYDRAQTTMRSFPLCAVCQAEYDAPTDRRFHAQPNACPACGPRISLVDTTGAALAHDALGEAARRLDAGEVVALKGLGGFHLACRADDEAAVATLRQRKAREARPLAVLVKDLASAELYGELDASAQAALTSPARPIVLVPKRLGSPLASSVAPAVSSIGLLLPYSPLHTLLIERVSGPLVLTSGNPTAEPLCRDNAEARERLAHIAQVFLIHDRDIERRVEDSVVLASPRGLVPLRRARGYVPTPIRVPAHPGAPKVLALGGDLKSALCLLDGSRAVLSEHLGDLENPTAHRHYTEALRHFPLITGIEPEVLAVDLHPGYHSTRLAASLGLPVVKVQHHHAHLAACAAEHGVTGPLVGVALDGTGYGTDGTLWGGEVLVIDGPSFERVGGLKAFPLLGGDEAARATWRPALGLLSDVLGVAAARTHFDAVDPLTLGVTCITLPRAPKTSSVGRLFDAVAWLLGLCPRSRYEAEAAMILEATAEGHAPAPLPPLQDDPQGRLDPWPLIDALLNRGDAPIPALAAGFHEVLAQGFARQAAHAAHARGLSQVALSGGCFANRLLLDRLAFHLESQGLTPLIHRQAPTTDGGLALGQAMIAAQSPR